MSEAPNPAPEQPQEEPSWFSVQLNRLKCLLSTGNPYKYKCLEIGREVEETRHPFKSPEGLTFAEMTFASEDSKKRAAELETYVGKLDKPIDIDDGTDKVKGVKTVAAMIDELPEEKYSAKEKGWLKKFALAVSKVESDHNYACLGPEIKKEKSRFFGTRALGRYQIMPPEWLKWSNEWLGGRVPEPTPQAQEYFAFRKFMANYDELGKAYGDSTYFRFFALATKWSGGGINHIKVDGKPVPLMHEETDYPVKVLKLMGLKPTGDERVIQLQAEAKFLAEEGVVRGVTRTTRKGAQATRRGWKALKKWWKERD